MPCPAYQYVINLLVVLLIRRDPVVYMMFRCGNVVFLITRSVDVAKFHIKPLSLLFSCKLSFPAVGLKTFSVHNFAWKLNIIFIWYIGKWSNTCCNYWWEWSFELSLLSLVGVCTPRAVVSHQWTLSSIHDFLWLINCTLWTCTMLQTSRSRVRFPMVSLEFFSDIILLVTLWPWGQLSL
jgi:hypothetical protein